MTPEEIVEKRVSIAFAALMAIKNIRTHGPGDFVSPEQAISIARSYATNALDRIIDVRVVPSKSPPFETFKRPTCKGSYFFNSACGNCEKCEWEKNRMALAPAPSEAPQTCACRFPDRVCGAPICKDIQSYSGWSHVHKADWMHWASPTPYDHVGGDVAKIFVPCTVCDQFGPDNEEHVLIDGHRFVCTLGAPSEAKPATELKSEQAEEEFYKWWQPKTLIGGRFHGYSENWGAKDAWVAARSEPTAKPATEEK